MSRYYIIVYGNVQGVGFRYTVTYLASNLELTGWVKNMDDGSVSMEVQGNLFHPHILINKLKIANRFIRIDDFDYKKLSVVENESSFKIKY